MHSEAFQSIRSVQDLEAPILCTAFARGKCAYGLSCWKSHDMSDKAALTAAFAEERKKRSEKICVHFRNGTCALGVRCQFKHSNDGFVHEDETEPLEAFRHERITK